MALPMKQENKHGLELISGSIVRDETDESSTKCGVECFHPWYIQPFASKKIYVLLYGILGMTFHIQSSYSTGTITTLEKNFGMSSLKTGFIKSASEISAVIMIIAISYIGGKGHMPRWLAAGTFLTGVGSFTRILPHMLYNSAIDEQINNTITKPDCDGSNNAKSTNSFLIFALGQFMYGFGWSTYRTCGVAYMDDNIRKNSMPILYALTYIAQMFGDSLGFLLSAHTLSIYVKPGYRHNLNKYSSQWIGAWWMGWIPIGITFFIITVPLLLFPKKLPRARLRQQNLTPTNNTISITDFTRSMKRIISNKIIVFSCISSAFLAIGFIAHTLFIPKYIELQFGLPPSNSNAVVGVMNIVGKSVGVLVIGITMTKFRPSARKLYTFCLYLQWACAGACLIIVFLGCKPQTVHGHWGDNHVWNLSESCNLMNDCNSDKYSPICDARMNQIYYSPCHAGCAPTDYSSATKVLSNCKCAPTSVDLTVGRCPSNCTVRFAIFISLLAFMKFVTASVGTIKTIIRFRSIGTEDKSLSVGIFWAGISFLGIFPSGSLYGKIFDWSCVVWERKCGKIGSCLIYDQHTLSYLLNFVAFGAFFIGCIFDMVTWYHSKNLQLYDEKEPADINNITNERLLLNGDNKIPTHGLNE